MHNYLLCCGKIKFTQGNRKNGNIRGFSKTITKRYQHYAQNYPQDIQIILQKKLYIR